jgi:ribosomal protein L37AE/L43A
MKYNSKVRGVVDLNTKPGKGAAKRKAYYGCPYCGEDDALKITRLRSGLWYCYPCEKEYLTAESA